MDETRNRWAGLGAMLAGCAIAYGGASWVWRTWGPPWIELPSDGELLGYAGFGLLLFGVSLIVVGLLLRAR